MSDELAEPTERWLEEQKIRVFSGIVRRAPVSVVLAFLILAAVKLVVGMGESTAGFEQGAYLAVGAAFAYPFMDLFLFLVGYTGAWTGDRFNRGGSGE